jgi:hypothetical protein
MQNRSDRCRTGTGSSFQEARKVSSASAGPRTVPSSTGGTFTVDVVDVGTGLGVFVHGPDFALVYDGGSNDDLGRGTGNRMLAFIKAVAPTLTNIDYLILSHPHHAAIVPPRCGRLGAVVHFGQPIGRQDGAWPRPVLLAKPENYASAKPSQLWYRSANRPPGADRPDGNAGWRTRVPSVRQALSSCLPGRARPPLHK